MTGGEAVRKMKAGTLAIVLRERIREDMERRRSLLIGKIKQQCASRVGRVQIGKYPVPRVRGYAQGI